MRRYSSSKDINLLIRRLLAEGWSYQSGALMGAFARPKGEALSACLALQAITGHLITSCMLSGVW